MLYEAGARSELDINQGVQEMGQVIRALFQQLFPPRVPEPRPDMANGYVVDYTPIPVEEIAAPAPFDDVIKANDWVPVNRKA